MKSLLGVMRRSSKCNALNETVYRENLLARLPGRGRPGPVCHKEIVFLHLVRTLRSPSPPACAAVLGCAASLDGVAMKPQDPGKSSGCEDSQRRRRGAAQVSITHVAMVQGGLQSARRRLA